MSGDVKLTYGSIGFEKVSDELVQLARTGSGAHKWFMPLQQSLIETGSVASSFFTKMNTDFKSVAQGAGHVVGELGKVAAGFTAVAGVVGGAATAAFALWSKSVLSTTESFRMLETSLYGATKSWESVNKVSTFAKEYASQYPAFYKDVMQAMQGFAYIPAMKPMIERGDVKEMKEMMDVIQGLATMRPEQGVQGAMFGLREALGGNWRSLQMRFDVPVESIARSAGMSMEQMKSNPEAAVNALKAFTKEFVGAETMAMMAKNLSNQVGNLKDKYDMWLDRLGKTGIYDKVVGYVMKLNDAFESLLKSDRFQQITKQIDAFLQKIVDGIAGIFTKGVDWDKVTDLPGLLGAFTKVGANAMEALKKSWEVSKEPVTAVLKDVLTFAANSAMDVARDLFMPIGKSMAEGISEGLKEGMEQNPLMTMAIGAGGGALMGKSFGPKGALFGALFGMELAALPTQIETLKGLWTSYSDFMEGIGLKIENSIRRAMGIPTKEIQRTESEPPSEARWHRLYQWRQESQPEPEMPSEARWHAMWQWRQRSQRGAFPGFGAEDQFSQYGAWARMAGMLAQAPEEAPKTASSLFATGAIPYEELKRRQKLEEFRSEQMKRLTGIAEMPEAGAEFKAKVFSEMFNVSMAGGDFGKAQNYMNAAVNSMVQAMKEQAGMTKEQLTAERDTARNTGEILREIRNGKTLYTNRPLEERATITQAVRKATSGGLSEEWSEDELRAEVQRALRQ